MGQRENTENIEDVVNSSSFSKIKRYKGFKVQLVLELKPHGHKLRFFFARWANEKLHDDVDFDKKK